MKSIANTFDDALPPLTWPEELGKALKLLATAFTYGGKGITTNRLLGSGTEPANAGMGTGSATASGSDTALFAPTAEARVSGTSSRQTTAANVPNDTYRLISTVTATGTPGVTEYGQFDTTVAAPTTTTTASATSAATSISVLSASGFPNSGTYYVQIAGEVLAVTGGQGTTTWTVTRAARGSTAAAIASGATIVGGESTNGGNMFIHANFSVINLASGDSIQFTSSLQYT